MLAATLPFDVGYSSTGAALWEKVARGEIGGGSGVGGRIPGELAGVGRARMLRCGVDSRAIVKAR
jgi:hypothetical protein